LSSEATADKEPADPATAGQLGVRDTWRQTPRPARALLAGVFVNRLAGFLQIFLVLFLTDRGYSAGQAGLALGLYGAGSVVGTFAGGWLNDRLSARTVTLISMMGSAVLLASILYAGYYPLLLLVVLAVGVVAQLYRPAAQAMITDLTPTERLIMVTAMYRLCLNLGTTAAPLLGVALASVSYDLLFWGEALAALTYGLIALVALPRAPRVAPVTPAAAAAGQPAEPVAQPPVRAGYLALLNDWRYLVFLVAFLLLCVVYSQYTAALPLAIVDSGLSTWWYGAVVTINAFIVVTCEVLATRWVQTWPLRLTQLSGFALLALGYGIYAIDIAPLFLILGTLVWTLSEIVGAPTVYAYPGLIAPAHLRGRYFGAMQSMFGLGSTLGPILGIALYAQVGQQMFMWTALVAVLATVIGRVGMRGPQRRDPAPEPAASQPSG
jgi:MFS family permease